MIINLVWVGFGGALGAMARYLLAGFVQQHATPQWFPWGTVTVNLLGCFIIGALLAFFEIKQIGNPHYKLFAFVGILGGFTTFSSFGLETLTLLEHQHFTAALINIGVQVILGISAVAVGVNSVNWLLS
ncbi:MAG: fluoride efflux transporter CrcB [Legionellales bacterium]|nr:fluoride efflux transporter CrcB [Legionellales bacterium]